MTELNKQFRINKTLKNVIVKLIKEVISEAPAPTIEPPTRPTAPTAPTKPTAPPSPTKPTTRPNPLSPNRPGIAPRPKALSHDVQAFLNQRGGLSEAIDTGEMPDLIDPSKRDKIENEYEYVEQILPDLGPAADRYLEIITSESYKQNIKKVAGILGISVSEIQNKFPNYPTMTMLAIKALNDIKRVESGMKQQLEKLAVNLVLDLTENKIIKQAVEDGHVIIDAKLGDADLTKSVTTDKMDEKMSNGLTVAENLNKQLNTDLSGDTEGKLRRTLANYMTQGDAVNKLYLFNIISDELDALSPNLSKKYGVLATITQVAYYFTPDFPITSDIVNMAAVGSEQVIPTGDKYTIKVRAMTFPYLVHELVKGLGDYNSMDLASQEELDTETMDDEIKQIMAGPALDARFRKLIPLDKIELLPLIKKLFYDKKVTSIDKIKVILNAPIADKKAQTEAQKEAQKEAQNEMNELIKKAEKIIKNNKTQIKNSDDEIDEYVVESKQDLKEFVQFMREYKQPLCESEYNGRKVRLGKPMQGDVKKFKVYVKNPTTGKIVKVNFGFGGSSAKGKRMTIKKNNPKRRKSFRARHNCDNPGPRTKARYWSCRAW